MRFSTLVATIAMLSSGVLALPKSEDFDIRKNLQKRKWDFSNSSNGGNTPACTFDQKVVILRSLEDALRLARAASTLTPDSQVYKYMMDGEGRADRNRIVTERFRAMMELILWQDESKLTFFCPNEGDNDETCFPKNGEGGAFAYVGPERTPEKARMGFCPPFFKFQELTDLPECDQITPEFRFPKTKASILVHELAHVPAIFGSVQDAAWDCWYGTSPIKRNAREAPWVNLANADSYAWTSVAAYFSNKCQKTFNMETTGNPGFAGGHLESNPRCKLSAANDELEFLDRQLQHRLISRKEDGIVPPNGDASIEAITSDEEMLSDPNNPVRFNDDL